jgi:hypothetical protein
VGNLSGVKLVAKFCGQCNCGCPSVSINENAPDERRIIISDDWGQRVEMSPSQFAELAAWAGTSESAAALSTL